MNATQKRYAIGRLVTITIERAKATTTTFNTLNKQHANLKTVTTKDFLDNPPDMLTVGEVAPSIPANLNNVFDMSGLQAEANARYAAAMGDYDTTNHGSGYKYLVHPLTLKQEHLGYLSNVLDKEFAALQTKLQIATDAIMLGGSEEAQAIIDNF